MKAKLITEEKILTTLGWFGIGGALGTIFIAIMVFTGYHLPMGGVAVATPLVIEYRRHPWFSALVTVLGFVFGGVTASLVVI